MSYGCQELGPFEDDHEDLESYVGDGFLGTSFKDKTSWLGAQELSENLEKGVRVVVRVRGCVNSTPTSFPQALATWRKTTWEKRGHLQDGTYSGAYGADPREDCRTGSSIWCTSTTLIERGLRWNGPKRSHVGMVVGVKQESTPAPIHQDPKKVLGISHTAGTLKGTSIFGRAKDEVITAKSETEETPVRDPDILSDCSSGAISPCKLEEVVKDIDMREKKDTKVEQVKVEPPLLNLNPKTCASWGSWKMPKLAPCLRGKRGICKWLGAPSAS